MNHAYYPCFRFIAARDEDPCGDCGWLHEEHQGDDDAEA